MKKAIAPVKLWSKVLPLMLWMKKGPFAKRLQARYSLIPIMLQRLSGTRSITLTPKPAEVWATIDIDVGVYIRQNPCADEVTCPRNGSAVPNNTVVQVLVFSEDNNWVQVRLYDGREGWVHRTYLSFDTQSTDGN